MSIQPTSIQTSGVTFPAFQIPLVHVTIEIPLDPLKDIQVGIWPIQHTYKVLKKSHPALSEYWTKLYQKSFMAMKRTTATLDLRGKAVVASTNIDGLGANRVGKGLTDRLLIAGSHPDQEPDLKVFWKAIANHGCLLVDLSEKGSNYAFRDLAKIKEIHIEMIDQIMKSN